MNNKQKKILAAALGLVIAGAAIIPVAMPNTAAAKWFTWAQAAKMQAGETAADRTEAVNAAAVTEAAVPEAAAEEMVIAVKEGNVEKVRIIETEAKETVTVAVDKKVVEELQVQADKGLQAWMLNPVEVVRQSANKYGFSAKDTFTLISQVYKGKSGTGEAQVLVGHSGKYYRVHLIQPYGSGTHKVWAVSRIEQVKVIVNPSKRPDVGPGVEGLDYSKVLKWQQNVDEGRELWRLDPMQVARQEGKAYGFTDKAVFTITKRVESSTIARHGQIDLKVEQDGKTYYMILVRPFGSDEGAIWTTYRVSGPAKPGQQPSSKVLFETGKYAEWKWYRGQNQYPKDMAFATVVDYEAQLKQDNRIPEFVLQRVKDVDYAKDVVLLAYLGTASGGYDIGIEKVTMNGNDMTVYVKTKSPAPNEMVTMDIRYPSDFVTIDRNIVDIWGGVNITFVDQAGKVLSKNKLVIHHYRH